MDYEKLHKYTINKLQQMVNSGKITVEIARGICADFVPESDDERIRKEILDFCKNRAEKYSNDPKYSNISNWIAWLEKQGEQKSAKFDDTNAKRMFIKALERVEEQNAKGYKLTDCDKNSWWEDFKAFCSEQNLANSAKTCKDEQDAAWSEKYIADVFEKVGLAKIVREQSNDNLTNALQDAMIELSKFTPQPKQEWSEKDESLYTRCLGILGKCKCGIAVNNVDEELNWLKSLRPQSKWRPSDEQMGVIEAVINNRSFQRRHLDSLYDDLKKLKV